MIKLEVMYKVYRFHIWHGMNRFFMIVETPKFQMRCQTTDLANELQVRG